MKAMNNMKKFTLDEYRSMVEAELRTSFLPKGVGYDGLLSAMDYSLNAGGKRIRPILLLEFCRIAGGDVSKALPVACAVEMLHTYSLIHDDLPCMDNDDLRRGKPTNHVVYGECTAVLAGDALQAAAFSTILSADLPGDARADCAAILANAVGADGMCGGQFLDMLGEKKRLDVAALNEINKGKTVALISAACKMGVSAAGGSPELLDAAARFGEALGYAFQIRDDMLDVISTAELLGKPIGSDEAEEKSTYMTACGREECERLVHSLTGEAKAAVRASFEDHGFLCDLADSLVDRLN